jgi:hypothetical protein
VAAEVEGLELDLADAQLLRRGVLRWLVLYEPLRSIQPNQIRNPRQGKNQNNRTGIRKGKAPWIGGREGPRP